MTPVDRALELDVVRRAPATVDDGRLREWCVAQLGSAPVERLFEAGHLSAVVAVELEDGRRVVVKVRPGAPSRVRACVRIQRHLFARGFPCPEPLTDPASFDDRIATAERYVSRRGPAPVPPPAGPCAALLAQLVETAPAADRHPALDPAPPWVGWDHDGPGVWPPPDDLDVDLDARSGAERVDAAAVRLRSRLRDAARRPPVVGHVDWEAHNLEWSAGNPVTVHDWDSLAIRSEAAIVGAAAAVYPSSGDVVAATVDQTAAFIDAYAQHRPLTDEDRQVAWAAGLWVLTFNAKKETCGGGTGYLEVLGRELPERAARAGIDWSPAP